MKRSLYISAVAVLVGCIDSPMGPADAEPPAVETQLHPGYCVAYSRIGSAEAGASGIRTAEYDDADRLVADNFDGDLDGDADQLGSYAYDARGRLVRYEIDDFADGTADEVRTYRWDDDDRMTHESWDLDADGSSEMEITFDHNDSGQRLTGMGQSDADEDPELVMDFIYEDGLLTVLAFDGLRGAPDAQPDRVAFYSYDDAGNLTFAFFDLDADGRSDIVVEYTYDCW